MRGLRIGLIGRGRWGTNIERTLQAFGDVSVQTYGKGEVVGDIDAVIIATPSDTHAEIALPFIVRGVPTFIEKPVTTNVHDAEHLRVAAEESGALVFVGHIYLYNPAFLALVEHSGSIGTIVCIEARAANNSPRPDGSVLWDWLPHHLVMARALLGRSPRLVRTVAQPGHEAREAAISTFAYGNVGLISQVSWVSERERLFRVIGTEGSIVFDDAAEKKVVIAKGESTEYPSYDTTPPLTRELQAFCEAVRNGVLDRDHLGDGIDIVKAIEAAEESVRTGGTVRIEASAQ